MISRIEALNYRCLKYINCPLGRFHVLVGPNGSGKSTFLDVLSFVGQLVSEGLDRAIATRTPNFIDLFWLRQGRSFEIAIEAVLPRHIQCTSQYAHFDSIRYHVKIGSPESYFGDDEIEILQESVCLGTRFNSEPDAGISYKSPSSTLQDVSSNLEVDHEFKNPQLVVSRNEDGEPKLISEDFQAGQESPYRLPQLGKGISAIQFLLGNERDFWATAWFRNLLSNGTRHMLLNSPLMRNASPPGAAREIKPDGSNLPWMIEGLKRKHPNRFHDWLKHIQVALPDIEDVQTVEREDDKHRYLILRYKNGVETPSWVVSDGTLRLLALTLPAYLVDFSGLYLIEEPENGIHPYALEIALQSLSSVYDAQVLLATHSPMIVGMTDVENVLCFSRTEEGATQIIPGNEHRMLQDWKGEVNLGTLFASGVLSL